MNELLTYIEQLQKLAGKKNINLREAFRKSGVQDSTYHRVKTGEFQLRQETAEKVWKYIHQTYYTKVRKKI
tara:strand:+ start:189 stop:401 length:213 start_codon:yes stop_codon:yes gene_type:complete